MIENGVDGRAMVLHHLRSVGRGQHFRLLVAKSVIIVIFVVTSDLRRSAGRASGLGSYEGTSHIGFELGREFPPGLCPAPAAFPSSAIGIVVGD